MIKEQLLKLIPELCNKNEDYIESIARKYKNFLEYSQIPNICYGFDDKSIIPPKLEKVFKNIQYAINDKYSFLFIFKNYQNISYLCYLMLQDYFMQSILNDSTIESILYIDTKLLVEDYKRLINYDKDELSLAPVHSIETLYRNIEDASIVMWDKLMMIDSNYDKDKILDIISIRNRKGLGNFYFGVEDTRKLSSVLGPNICNEMYQYTDAAFGCDNYSINVSNKKEVDMFQ